jgi:hypothetical protein
MTTYTLLVGLHGIIRHDEIVQKEFPLAILLFAILWTQTPFASFEIDRSLNHDQIAVVDDKIAVLDPSKEKVYVHDLDNGALLHEFDLDNVDPGVFAVPRRIEPGQGTFIVESSTLFSEFMPDGTLIDKHPKPYRYSPSLIKTSTGFLRLRTLDSKQVLMSYIEGEERQILTFNDKYDEPERPRICSGVFSFRYNPARTSLNLIRTPDGKFVFACESSTLTIYKIDAETLEIVKTHHEDLPKHRFDKAWAEAQLEDRKAIIKAKLRAKLNVIRDYPEYWPAVKSWWLGPDQHIYVALNSDEPTRPIIQAFDWDLNPVTPLFNSPAELLSTVHVDGDGILFITFEDDKFGLVRGTLNNLPTLVKLYSK